ncbi:hypothetical protein N658DRAFT_328262 [Parathielavia hyrcaniae]|uniref:Uncharacterized protein n=1 Tax=Parathielavia hyrcaniae TaxID=113614 RepID=A0AAN6Q8Y8_9PEZI|nr:hypothetical protein N658DRAFT_328262 [Parathielavia hyrcaniae]
MPCSAHTSGLHSLFGWESRRSHHLPGRPRLLFRRAYIFQLPIPIAILAHVRFLLGSSFGEGNVLLSVRKATIITLSAGSRQETFAKTSRPNTRPLFHVTQ